MRDTSVTGAEHVGLLTAACLAKVGQIVILPSFKGVTSW